MLTGNINFIFHSHLPWVMNHGNWPHGEDWLFEAVSETYIPFIKMVDELRKEGISSKFTIGFSPVLCEQIAHPSFFEKFKQYCNYKIEYARRDEIKFINENQDIAKVNLAKYWQWFYKDAVDFVRACENQNILTKFKEFQDNGLIEIMTCGATHGYLPLLGSDRTVEFQIKLAVENYKKHFGRKPNGIWLPECGYRPAYAWKTIMGKQPFDVPYYRFGIEELLEKYELNYFVSDQKNLLESMNVGDEEGNIYGELTPYKIYNVVSRFPKQGGRAKVFTRAFDLSMQVWSGEKGYPGSPDYLDFHKKEGGSMLRYWRVTDIKLDMQYKDLYRPEWTWDKTELQAHHFIKNLENTSGYFADKYKIRSTISLPFDTELFGHWWFEGVDFIKHVLRGIHASPYIDAATCSEQLEFASGERINLKESSWGKNNDHSVWINQGTEWCWDRIYEAEKLVLNLVDSIKKKRLDKEKTEIANQIVRSLQALISSDWEFLIENGSAVDYSEMRISNHFSDIYRMNIYFEKLMNKQELYEHEKEDLNDIFNRDDLFSETDFKDF